MTKHGQLLRRQFNPVRLTLLMAMLFTGYVAALFRTAPIVFMAALLASAPIVAVALSRLLGRGLSVTRLLPESGTVGDTISGHLVVHNRARWPVFLVEVESGSMDEDQTGEAALEPLHDIALIASILRPGARATWQPHWLLRRRGVHQLGPARIGASDPMQLFARFDPRTQPHQITVLPRPVPVDRLGFLGGALSGLRAPQHATLVADALDFHGVRQWRPGESIRRIHWRSTARTGNIHVVEWEENVASDMVVLLDNQAATVAGTAHDNTLETAITLVASIAAYLLESGYQFQLFFWERAPHEAACRVGRFDARNASGLRDTLHALARIEAVPDTAATLPRLARGVLPLLARHRHVLVIGSTLSDISAALNILSALGRESGRPQALALDAVSFALGQTSTIAADDPVDALTAAAHPSSAAPAQPGVRVVRRGDSLGAILEGRV